MCIHCKDLRRFNTEDTLQSLYLAEGTLATALGTLKNLAEDGQIDTDEVQKITARSSVYIKRTIPLAREAIIAGTTDDISGLVSELDGFAKEMAAGGAKAAASGSGGGFDFNNPLTWYHLTMTAIQAQREGAGVIRDLKTLIQEMRDPTDEEWTKLDEWVSTRIDEINELGKDEEMGNDEE